MMLSVVLLCAAAVPVVPGTTDEGASPDDLRALQGVWQLEFKASEHTIRVQKEIRGNRETLRTYRDGEFFHEHVVEFELSEAGGAKTFRWKNGENTFGPSKGKEMPDGAFIYRLKHDRWTTLFGFLPGEEERPIMTEVYQKVGD